MRGWVILTGVLVFPALEILVLVWLGQWLGWWLLLVLAAAAMLGWMLLLGERLMLFGRVMEAVQSGQPLAGALLDSGRTLLAGVLLIFPGVISDVAAVALLLWPRRARPPAREIIIDGEWRRRDGEDAR